MRDISRRHLLLNLINIKQRHQNKEISENVIFKFKVERDINKKDKYHNRVRALVKTL